ncbi:MAG TPA: hypothetical protein QF753_10850 [Victivallales bacterium]|nr:hypothetical protein [Victivallales bacterium]
MIYKQNLSKRDTDEAVLRTQSDTVLFTMLNGILRDFMPMVNASLAAVVMKAYPNRNSSFIEKLYSVIQKNSGISALEKIQKYNQSYPNEPIENIDILNTEAIKLKEILSKQVVISSAGQILLDLFHTDISYTISIDYPEYIEKVMKANHSLIEARNLLFDTLGHTRENGYNKFSHVERILKKYPHIKNVFLIFDAPGEINQSRMIADKLIQHGYHAHVIGIVYPVSAKVAKEALKTALNQINYKSNVNINSLSFNDLSFQSLADDLKNMGADYVLSGTSNLQKLSNLIK